MTGKVLRFFRGHWRSILGLAVSPTGTMLASASADGTAAVWNIRTGRRLLILPVYPPRRPDRSIHEVSFETVDSVCFSPAGTYVATGSADGRVRIWSASTGRCMR